MTRARDAWEFELWARGLRGQWWRATFPLLVRAARPRFTGQGDETETSLPAPSGAGIARELPLPGVTGRPVPARRP